MSYLTEIKSFWSGNSTLTNTIPATRFFVDVIPERNARTFPYATITVLGAKPTWLTASAYIETVTFTVDVFHTSAASLDTAMTTIAGQFESQSISAATIYNLRQDSRVYAEQDDPKPTTIYHGIITIEWAANRTRS